MGLERRKKSGRLIGGSRLVVDGEPIYSVLKFIPDIKKERKPELFADGGEIPTPTPTPIPTLETCRIETQFYEDIITQDNFKLVWDICNITPTPTPTPISCDECIRVSFTYNGVDYEFDVPKSDEIVNGRNKYFTGPDTPVVIEILWNETYWIIIIQGIAPDNSVYTNSADVLCPTFDNWVFEGVYEVENLVTTLCYPTPTPTPTPIPCDTCTQTPLDFFLNTFNEDLQSSLDVGYIRSRFGICCPDCEYGENLKLHLMSNALGFLIMDEAFGCFFSGCCINIYTTNDTFQEYYLPAFDPEQPIPLEIINIGDNVLVRTTGETACINNNFYNCITQISGLCTDFSVFVNNGITEIGTLSGTSAICILKDYIITNSLTPSEAQDLLEIFFNSISNGRGMVSTCVGEELQIGGCVPAIRYLEYFSLYNDEYCPTPPGPPA